MRLPIPAGRILRLGLAVCTFAVVGVAGASPASARTYAQAASICLDGAVCLFQHVNFDGSHIAFRHGINDFRGFGFNDTASSYLNDGSSTFCLYENVDYAWFNPLGRSYRIRPSTYETSLHDNSNFGDLASSGWRISSWQSC